MGNNKVAPHQVVAKAKVTEVATNIAKTGNKAKKKIVEANIPVISESLRKLYKDSMCSGATLALAIATLVRIR